MQKLNSILKPAVLGFLVLGACTHMKRSDYKTGADYVAPANATETQDHQEDETLSAEPSTSPTGTTFKLRWPVKNVRITQQFEPSSNPKHKGIDLGGVRGEFIVAAHEGRVVYTGRDFHGYGNMILIEYDNEWATLYGHLQKIKVRQGQHVTAGTLIGTMGRTGHATGVHLHFELMHKKEPVDPLTHLSGYQYVAHQ
jgi:murein DD-endopeptidase MepM/ murein hydrolase activator NlpD